MSDLECREISYDDFGLIWPVIEPVVIAGDTYAYPADADYNTMQKIWFYDGKANVFAFFIGDEIVGTYYIKPNNMGPASHIANAGFITSDKHRGKGIASKMADHMLDMAKAKNFRAIQFNMVLEDNISSLKIWQKRGFEVAGRIEEAFLNSKNKYIDALILYKKLV